MAIDNRNYTACTTTEASYDKLRAELLRSGRECPTVAVPNVRAAANQLINGTAAAGRVHIVALPYPAQGHIVPMMELCKKLAADGFMITFVNTEHNHARLVQSLCGDGGGDDCECFKEGEETGEGSGGVIRGCCCCSARVSNIRINERIRLAWVAGGLPPEMHGHQDAVITAFLASEAVQDGFTDLLHTLNSPSQTSTEGWPTTVSCILSDVMMSWSQQSADALRIPRLAFWTSSAAVYYVIHHMFHLISHGFPTFKDVMKQQQAKKLSTNGSNGSTTTISIGERELSADDAVEGYNKMYSSRKQQQRHGNGDRGDDVVDMDDNDEEEDQSSGAIQGKKRNMCNYKEIEEEAAAVDVVVACIPGLPPMDLNDLPIIMRSEPQDFIYQFLVRQLTLTQRSAALLLNTFTALEETCIARLQQAMAPSVPVLAVGPLLPPWVLTTCPRRRPRHDDDQLLDHVERSKTSNSTGNSNPAAAVAGYGGDDMDQGGCSSRSGAEAAAAAGIFKQDAGCLQWLDSKPPSSVLYISFGSIFRMECAQFVELVAGLRASGRAFLWAMRPDFLSDVPSGANYTDLLPDDDEDHLAHNRNHNNNNNSKMGLFTQWAPQLQVLAHPAVAAFLTHCGWNSTLESVALGLPMLCWPDIGERRTNGRMAVSLWGTALEFHRPPGSSLVDRHEVKRVIDLLMDPSSATSTALYSRAAYLQEAAQFACRSGGSSTNAWELLSQTLLQRQQHSLHYDDQDDDACMHA